MNIKSWNKDIKRLRAIILKEEYIEESKELCLSLHSMVHLSLTSGIDKITFEDELWEGLDENTFKNSTNEKGRTVAYGIWHATRIEDITMNSLVMGEEEIIFKEKWKDKINSKIIHTGNSLTNEEILDFSKDINMEELKNYRVSVGRRTREIIQILTTKDMKNKIEKSRLIKVLEQGSVLNIEECNWLIEFWGRKNVSGIILMPATRHNLVHISESLSAKKSKVKRLL